MRKSSGRCGVSGRLNEKFLRADRNRRKSAAMAALSMAAVSGLGLFLTPYAARAGTDVWGGTTNGSWTTGSNWSPNATPGTGDTIDFNNSTSNNTTTDDDTTMTSIAALNFT